MESHMTFSLENLYLKIVDLGLIFLISMVVEWMSNTTYLSNFPNDQNVRVGLIQTGFYGVRMAAAYTVMLAVMSFDVGILSAAVAGYSLGFFVFGSRVLDVDELGYRKPSDLPPLIC